MEFLQKKKKNNIKQNQTQRRYRICQLERDWGREIEGSQLYGDTATRTVYTCLNHNVIPPGIYIQKFLGGGAH